MQGNKQVSRKYKPLVISGCSGVGKVLPSLPREP